MVRKKAPQSKTAQLLNTLLRQFAPGIEVYENACRKTAEHRDFLETEKYEICWDGETPHWRLRENPHTWADASTVSPGEIAERFAVIPRLEAECLAEDREEIKRLEGEAIKQFAELNEAGVQAIKALKEPAVIKEALRIDFAAHLGQTALRIRSQVRKQSDRDRAAEGGTGLAH